MELYILDSFLRRVAVIDVFESLIWTDRYKELGDFQLVIAADSASRGLLLKNTLIASDFSYRVMKLETIEDSVDADGNKMLTVTGNSLEKILVQRVAAEALYGPVDPPGEGEDALTVPTWDLEGLPADLARYIFDQICVEGLLSDSDVLPYIVGGTIFPSDTILEPSSSISWQLPPKSLYDAIKEVCDLFDMGFRLVRDPVLCNLHFDIYMGRNRTSDQTIDPAVVFSPELDNLTNTKELTSVAEQMDAAYVFSPRGTKLVYAGDASDFTVGFERKVLMVDASDLTDATDIDAALIQRGQVALAEHRGLQLFDGEINQQSSYRYGVDYNVGDLVEQRDANGFANYLRVTEQILTSDGEGERSYPTLTKELTVTPGSWAGWPFEDEWADMGELEWADAE